MVLPKYVVTEWYGEGKSILSFKKEAPISEEKDDKETSAKSSGKITCYMSSLYVSEYEERTSSTLEVTDAEEKTLSTLEATDADDTISMPVTLNGDSLPVDDNVYTCPPDVPQAVWQSWLEHWENWKEIYIPLSWIQKNRSLCKDSHVEWHDTYIKDYPWVIPVIQDGLDESIHTSDCDSKEQEETAQIGIDENQEEKGDSDKELQEKSESDKESQEKAESHKKSQEEAESENRPQEILVNDNNKNSVDKTILEKKSQEKANTEDESEDKTGTEDTSHQSSDIEDSHHDLEAKKKLDKLYSEFSNARYWVHLRSFLQNNGVEPSESLIKFFAEQGQVDFCRSSIKSDDSLQDFTIVGDYEINVDKFKESANEGSQELSVANEVKHTDDSNEGDFTTVSESTLAPEELEKTGTKRRKGDREEVNLGENEAGKNSSMHSKRPRHERNHNDVNGHKKNLNTTDDDEDSEEFEDCTLMKAVDGAKMKKSSKQKRKKKILSSPTSHAGLGWLMNYIGKKDRDRNSSGENAKEDDLNTEVNVDNIFSVEFCQGTQENALGQSNGLSSLGNLPSEDYQFKADELNLKEDCRKLSKCFDSQVDTALISSCDIKTDVNNMDKGSNDESSDDDVCENDHNLKNKQSAENEIGEDCYEADEEEVCKDGESDPADCDSKNNKVTSKEGTTALTPSKPWFLYPFSSLKNFLFMVASHFLSLFFPSVSSSRPVSSSLAFIRKLFGFSSKEKSSVKKKFKKPCQIRLEKWLQQACNKSVNLPTCEPFSRFHSYEDARVMPTLFQSLELVRQGDGSSFLTVNTLNLQDPLFSDHLNTDEDDWENCHVTFDKEGNPVNEPKSIESSKYEDREEGIWKEITANHKFVSYKNGKETPPPDLPEHLHKYWVQRHRLFLRYDEGVKLDDESWYSVTPEMIAAHHAYRCKCDVVVDAFCGSGGNAIQLASTCQSVIAIDIDPAKIELARHNASIYGVQDRIKFIVGDFLELAPTLNADVVLLSPPWGGTEYLQEKVYDVKKLGGVMECEEVMKAARLITQNIALYLPRSSNLCQIIELAGLDGAVDLEYNYMNKKLKAVTAYFGDLVHY
ncbi:uro-adherence factor A [Palaemon carinicauda]|uniref:uro-adherence factor A n=1 Tax=Palaemon carinicauda TaxID=392227 RepID=UPI0035B5B9B3